MASPASNILVVMALQNESQGLFEEYGAPVIFTGVGKVNATYTLTKALLERKAAGQKTDLVINLGSAGSRAFPRGSLVLCNKFVQHDMNVSALGFKHGETPYDTLLPMVLEHNRKLEKEIFTGICGSGDSFATSELKVECNVADMEAYALAKVCLFEKVPFISIKYITDGADEEAANDWEAALKDGAKKLLEIYKYIEEAEKKVEADEKKN